MKRAMIFGFSHPKAWNPISSLIRAAEHTPFSHAYVRYYDELANRNVVYQASHSALNYIGYDRFKQIEVIIEEYRLDVDDDQFEKMLAYCVDTAGAKYGRVQFAGMALVRLAAFMGWTIKNPFRDGAQTQVCSELAANILHLAEFDFDPETAEDEGPHWFYALIRRYASEGIVGRIS